MALRSPARTRRSLAPRRGAQIVRKAGARSVRSPECPARRPTTDARHRTRVRSFCLANISRCGPADDGSRDHGNRLALERSSRSSRKCGLPVAAAADAELARTREAPLRLPAESAVSAHHSPYTGSMFTARRLLRPPPMNQRLPPSSVPASPTYRMDVVVRSTRRPAALAALAGPPNAQQPGPACAYAPICRLPLARSRIRRSRRLTVHRQDTPVRQTHQVQE